MDDRIAGPGSEQDRCHPTIDHQDVARGKAGVRAGFETIVNEEAVKLAARIEQIFTELGV